mmetsp:Transcript_3112/g.9512  ORF Transcript_3112/g.9512 Transcript_3112/m.9512 type:complete len:431 (-) Transcript_3112:420-1712(-)
MRGTGERRRGPAGRAAGRLLAFGLPGRALGAGLGGAWAAARGQPVERQATQELPGSVELVVRSYARELPVLLLFLRSVELYWPWDRALVVLDDSDADRKAASSLPSWCRAIHEASPPHLDKYIPVRYGKGKPLSTGYVRAQWSMFQMDLYTDCEYVAFFDSDVVLFTFVAPAVLFSAAGKAIIKGHRGAPMFNRAISILGWQWVAEFMQDFPLLLHRSTFGIARRQIARAATGVGTRCWKLGLCRHWDDLSKQLDRPRKAWGFDEAFLWLNNMLDLYGRRGLNDSTILPCAQSILGHVAWHNQRGLYSWSIMDEGLLAGPPWRRRLWSMLRLSGLPAGVRAAPHRRVRRASGAATGGEMPIPEHIIPPGALLLGRGWPRLRRVLPHRPRHDAVGRLRCGTRLRARVAAGGVRAPGRQHPGAAPRKQALRP